MRLFTGTGIHPGCGQELGAVTQEGSLKILKGPERKQYLSLFLMETWGKKIRIFPYNVLNCLLQQPPSGSQHCSHAWSNLTEQKNNGEQVFKL